INHSAKSFLETDFRAIRQRPCGPLLAMLLRRLRRFDPQRVAARTPGGRVLARRPGEAVLRPGAEVQPHQYWLVSVMVEEPKEAIAALFAAGFDATRASSMRPIDPPPDRPELDPVCGREAIDKMVFVPCYADLPHAEVERMAQVLLDLKARQAATQRRKP